jgi:putative ABC transport system permease protein
VTGGALTAPRRMTPGVLARVASVGLRTRKLRASLSALGITIGVAAIVAVLGLSKSSQAGLLAQIDQLGTNVLTVTPGQSLTGLPAELPAAAPAMIGRISGVAQVQDVGIVSSANAYRNPLIPAVETNSLTVDAATLGLPRTVGAGVAQGSYLNAATAREPVAVLGAGTAALLGINQVSSGERIWLGRQWFYVAGILHPVLLDPSLDTSVLVGFPAAGRYLGFDGHPSTIYVRTQTSQVSQVDRVQSLLAAAADPEDPSQAAVSQPSAALVARADAASALNGLYLGLGAVALLVGAVGVANIMVISVLERRSEIGLRRALGATKGHIRVQFLSESILLALTGGLTGVLAGAAATASYAHAKGWAVVVPPAAWAGGIGAAIGIGALAGLLPAIRAARMSPTQALWSL